MDIEDRKCYICDKQAVETEEHFLTDCPALKATRDRYMEQFKAIRDVSSLVGIELMKQLFYPDLLKITARIVQDMYEERHLLLYKANNKQTSYRQWPKNAPIPY